MAYLMIVDDDEDFACAAAKALGSDGHEVRVELEIEAAVKSIEQRRPDLLILDVMFPEDESAGFELARRIAYGSEAFQGIPVMMLTAINMKFPLGFGPSDIDDCWMPVRDFVEKPVDLQVLRTRVSALLQPAAGPG
jgi:DNA-binding response OmpR family regulator